MYARESSNAQTSARSYTTAKSPEGRCKAANAGHHRCLGEDFGHSTEQGPASLAPQGGQGTPERTTASPHSITVAVRADDAIAEEGAVAYLKTHSYLTVVAAEQIFSADVLLVITNQVTEETLSFMKWASGESSGREIRIVLVASAIKESQVVRAVGYGLTSILLRRDISFSDIVQAITAVQVGHAQIPAFLVRTLVDEIRKMRHELINGTQPTFDSREIDVLKLLAQGLSTAEVAVALNYSERTVKSIIHTITNRSRLRNRTHAVAFALTAGLI